MGNVTRRRLAMSIAAIALGCSLALLLGEGALRVLWPASSSGYRTLTPGSETVFTPRFHPGVAGPSRFKVNSMGARGREWEGERAAQYRVLCIGGSTTECLVTDQSRVWTTLLEQRLGALPDGRRVWVGNVGKSGLSSEHHLLQLRHLLPVYDPDCVVVLVGANDLGGRLRHRERYDPNAADRPDNQRLLVGQAFAILPGRFGAGWPDDPWYKRTRLWDVARVLKYQILRRPEAQDLEGRNLQNWRERRAHGRRTDVLPPLEEALARYRRNLGEMAALARQRGVALVLVTQPTLWRPGLSAEERRLLWLGGVGDFREQPGAVYYEVEPLARALEAYNQALLDVCREEGLPCVDLAAVTPRTTEYFYDDFHFTDHAQGLIADTLAPALRSAAAAPRAAQRGGGE